MKLTRKIINAQFIKQVFVLEYYQLLVNPPIIFSLSIYQHEKLLHIGLSKVLLYFANLMIELEWKS